MKGAQLDAILARTSILQSRMVHIKTLHTFRSVLQEMIPSPGAEGFYQPVSNSYIVFERCFKQSIESHQLFAQRAMELLPHWTKVPLTFMYVLANYPFPRLSVSIFQLGPNFVSLY